jgi:hypothetical protein
MRVARNADHIIDVLNRHPPPAESLRILRDTGNLKNIIPSGHRLPFGVPRTMKSASAQDLTNNDRAQNESDFFSSESALGILKLILAGSELSEVLTIIARLVESTGNGTLCTIWLPHADGKHLYCASGWAASGPCNPQRRNSRVGRRSGELSYCESTSYDFACLSSLSARRGERQPNHAATRKVEKNNRDRPKALPRWPRVAEETPEL